MNEHVSRESLKKLITMGKEAKALEKMLLIADSQSPDMQKLIALQSNRYQKLRKKRLAGTIDQASANVMASQISSDLFEILDTFNFPGDEDTIENISSSKEKETKKENILRPKTFSSLGGLLVISGVFLVLSAIFYKINLFDRKDNSSIGSPTQEIGAGTRGGELGENPDIIFSIKDWVGTWEAYLESDDKQELTGLLVFSKEKGRLEVEGEGIVSYGLTLRRIEFDKQKQVMEGTLEMDEEIAGRVPGTFSFTLEANKQTFEGTYTLGDRNTERFSWRGIKVDK